jgi:hypothetical protein
VNRNKEEPFQDSLVVLLLMLNFSWRYLKRETKKAKAINDAVGQGLILLLLRQPQPK